MIQVAGTKFATNSEGNKDDDMIRLKYRLTDHVALKKWTAIYINTIISTMANLSIINHTKLSVFSFTVTVKSQ